jgi:hypothetical protein
MELTNKIMQYISQVNTGNKSNAGIETKTESETDKITVVSIDDLQIDAEPVDIQDNFSNTLSGKELKIIKDQEQSQFEARLLQVRGTLSMQAANAVLETIKDGQQTLNSFGQEISKEINKVGQKINMHMPDIQLPDVQPLVTTVIAGANQSLELLKIGQDQLQIAAGKGKELIFNGVEFGKNVVNGENATANQVLSTCKTVAYQTVSTLENTALNAANALGNLKTQLRADV